MKTATALLSLVLCQSLLSTPALANDSTFGGAASDLVPLEEARVRMVREDILVEYRRQRWHVTARYVFENLTEKDVRLQVGFPEYRCQDDDQDCHNAPFENLRTEIDGKEVAHRQGTLTKDHAWKPHLGVVWLYDVTFPARKEIHILHTYSVASGSDVEGNQFTTYVTRTGALWAGTIGHARFTFRLPATAHTVIVPKGIALKSLELVDPEGPAPYVEVVCEQTNWNPSGDLDILFNDGVPLAMARLGAEARERSGLRAEDLCPPWDERENATPAQRQMCVNDQYAVAGYPFQRKTLQSYYYGDPFPWRKEPSPWSPDETWYVRGLRPLPGLPTWQTSTPSNEPSSADATPRSSEEAQAGSSTPTAPAPPDASPTPPPVPPRSGSCGCQVPLYAPGSYWPLVGLVLLRRRRRAR